MILYDYLDSDNYHQLCEYLRLPHHAYYFLDGKQLDNQASKKAIKGNLRYDVIDYQYYPENQKIELFLALNEDLTEEQAKQRYEIYKNSLSNDQGMQQLFNQEDQKEYSLQDMIQFLKDTIMNYEDSFTHNTCVEHNNVAAYFDYIALHKCHTMLNFLEQLKTKLNKKEGMTNDR